MIFINRQIKKRSVFYDLQQQQKMSINWIATNPKDPRTLFNEAPMIDSEFEELIGLVIHVNRYK